MRIARYAVIVIAVLVPATWFAFRVGQLGNWIIDDAGISMAYGKHLLEGYGLVAQPGQPPVEGYSNPLWVFLMLPLQMLDGFRPFEHPKWLAIVLYLSACVMPWLYFRRTASGLAAILPAAIILGVSAPLGIWSASGLENPLYLFLVLALAVSATARQPGTTGLIRTGILAFLVVITRPEGIIYLLPSLAATWIRLTRSEGSSLSLPVIRKICIQLAAAAIPGMAFLLWRKWYFGEWVPNTYFAKSGEKGLSLIFDLSQHLMLLESVAGLPAGITLAIVLLAIISACGFAIACSRKEKEPMVLVASGLIFLLTGYLNYLILPPDWMPEFRFATPFFAFLALLPGFVLVSLPRITAWLAMIPILVCTGWFAMVHEARFSAFTEAPTVPYCFVRYLMVERYGLAATRLEIHAPSLLTPDCGATFYEASFPVYDLAGLCDNRYAKCTQGKDPAGLASLVLETDKPVFVDLSPNWSCTVRLHDDPGFLKAYYPIVQDSTDACGAMYPFGVYVRKDAIGNDSTRIQQLGNLFRQGPVYRLPIWRSCGCTARHRSHTRPLYSGKWR